MSDAEDGSDEGSESEDEETPKKKVPASLLLGIMLNHFFVLLPATYNRGICLCVGWTRKKEANWICHKNTCSC